MSEIRKAAEERFPLGVVGNWAARADFIAGAEWMREQAAQVAETSNSQVLSMGDVADAIRKIGEDDD